ncbi:MAG: DUF1145 domain-containing protein [Candidatus Hydrogenedens sp.]|nr:DUF1145 domain-containing protein [Candidatus Hydrogenedens sp.]
MNNTILLGGKFVSIAFWGAVIVNVLRPYPEPYHALFLGAGGLILLIHIVECALFLQVVRDNTKNLTADLIQVLLFGVFHVKVVQQRGA